MAAGQNQRNRKNDPMLTKTGKPRLGPLNVEQLNKLLEASNKAKQKDKIRREISRRPMLVAAPSVT